MKRLRRMAGRRMHQRAKIRITEIPAASRRGMPTWWFAMEHRM